LATRTNVGLLTISRFEPDARSPNSVTLSAMQRVLEAADVEFLDGDGIRLRARQG